MTRTYNLSLCRLDKEYISIDMLVTRPRGDICLNEFRKFFYIDFRRRPTLHVSTKPVRNAYEILTKKQYPLSSLIVVTPANNLYGPYYIFDSFASILSRNRCITSSWIWVEQKA